MDELDMPTGQLFLLFFLTRLVQVEVIYMKYSGPIKLPVIAFGPGIRWLSMLIGLAVVLPETSLPLLPGRLISGLQLWRNTDEINLRLKQGVLTWFSGVITKVGKPRSN